MANWRVARTLLELRDQINEAYPGRDKGSDGTIGDPAHQAEGSASDHNPWVRDSSGTPVVTALDITHDPAHGVDTWAMARRIARAMPAQLKYVISHGEILFGPADENGHDKGVWKKYTGSSDPHDNHMHISASKRQPLYDLTTAWPGVTQEETDMDAAQSQELADVHFAVTQIPDPTNPGKRIPLQTAVSRLLSAAPTLTDAQVQAIADRLVASQGNSLTAEDHASIVADIRSVFADAGDPS